MPSSGPIRRVIAPVLRTMRDRIADANGLLDQPVINQATAKGLRVVRTQLESSMERVNELNTRWLEYMDNLEENALHSEEELYDNYPPQPEAELDLPHEHFMDLHERARGIVELINLTLEGHQGQQLPAQQVNHPNVVQQAVRLPTLELPRFDGEAHRYRTWWNAFSIAVDQQPTLSAFQKHTYLLMCLPANSPARKAIEHYEPSDANYQHVLNILKDRFGNSKRLIDNLYSELMHLPRATDASSSLRNFMDTVDRICYQLESQGQSPDSTQTMLQIRSKLPSGVLRELLMREKESRRLWTHKDLLKQLQEIISLREEVLYCVYSMDKSPHVKREIKPQTTPPRDIVRTFAAVAQHQHFETKKYNRRICSLCAKPGHLPNRCRIYPTARDRLRRLLETNRCIRCLREGHHASDCQNQWTCYRCKGPHLRLACQQAAVNQSCQWTAQPRTDQLSQPHLACQQAAVNQSCQWTAQPRSDQLSQPHLACQQAAVNQSCQWTAQPRSDQLSQPHLACQQAAVNQSCQGTAQPRSDQLSQPHLACQQAAVNQSCQWTAQPKQKSAQLNQLRLACQQAAVNQNRQCTTEPEQRIAVAHEKQQQNKDKSEEPAHSILSLHTSGPAKKNSGSMASYITKDLVKELQPPRVVAEQMKVEAFGGSTNDSFKFYSPMYELKLQRSDETWE
uniref:CCHC-type domain-containing protein n=1 Tax=Meloidogyne incognita TaxID=6306 RepID=A0A914NGS0_MELIC